MGNVANIVTKSSSAALGHDLVRKGSTQGYTHAVEKQSQKTFANMLHPPNEPFCPRHVLPQGIRFVIRSFAIACNGSQTPAPARVDH